MVLIEHKKFYSEIFKIDGFLKSPFLMFGFQELSKGFDSRLKDAKSFKGLLHLMGVQDVTVLDYEDPRADIHYDMNFSFNQNTNRLIGGFKVVCDIGCLEHVFNSAQAMKNCMDAVEVGGLYVLHTPVAGYCYHGFHTFNQLMLKWVLKHNGFDIEYCKFSNQQGVSRLSPTYGAHNDNVLMWLVARKVEIKDKFYVPIQDRQQIHRSYMQETDRNIVKQLREDVKIGDWDITTDPVNTISGGYIGEGHDPIDLSNQNLNI